MLEDGADGFREYVTIYLLTLGCGALLALTLLALHRPAGRIVAWVFLPFFLIFMPIGTAAGVIVIIGLHSEEMRKYLNRAPADGPAARPMKLDRLLR